MDLGNLSSNPKPVMLKMCLCNYFIKLKVDESLSSLFPFPLLKQRM